MTRILTKALCLFQSLTIFLILSNSLTIALNIEYKQKNYYLYSLSEQRNLEQLQQEINEKIKELDQKINTSKDLGSQIALNHKRTLLNKALIGTNNIQNEKRLKISHIMMKYLNLGSKFHREIILNYTKILCTQDIYSVFFGLANMQIMNFKIEPQINLKFNELSSLWFKPSITIGWKHSLRKKFYNLNYQISGKLAIETKAVDKIFLNSVTQNSETNDTNTDKLRVKEALHNSEKMLSKMPKYFAIKTDVFFSDWYIQYQYKRSFIEIYQVNIHQISLCKKISAIYVEFTGFSETNNKTKDWFANLGMTFKVGLSF